MILNDIKNKLPGKDIGTINEYVFTDSCVTWSVDDWKDNNHTVTVPLKLISRSEALVLLHEEDTSRFRNYEIEQELHERFDIGYFIPNLCPFNGFSIYTKPVIEVNKMFLVFGGQCYYPLTGANDIVSSCDDKEEAIRHCKEIIGTPLIHYQYGKYEWSHVYDIEEEEIIFSIGKD